MEVVLSRSEAVTAPRSPPMHLDAPIAAGAVIHSDALARRGTHTHPNQLERGVAADPGAEGTGADGSSNGFSAPVRGAVAEPADGDAALAPATE
jgi:hypothetical protein